MRIQTFRTVVDWLFDVYYLDMDPRIVFGNNLKKYRKDSKMSQDQLAEKLEITPKHLSSLETGKTFVSAELLEKISSTLVISYSELFSENVAALLNSDEKQFVNIAVCEEIAKFESYIKEKYTYSK